MGPFDTWKLSIDMWRLGVEAQQVIGMRMLGMAGVWSVTPSENRRMFEEKPTAFAKGAIAATNAMMRGLPPPAIAAAWVAPISRSASANRKRLARRGLKRS